MDDSALPDDDLVAVGLAVAALLVVAYATLIAGQILVVVWFALTAVTLWLLYRFVVAVETIADAQRRMADAAASAATHDDGSTDDETPGAASGDD